MGRQWNQIIESLGPLSGGTGLSINANLTEIEALLTTLQADVADGIPVAVDDLNTPTLMQLDGNGNLSVRINEGTVTANPTYATSGGTGPTIFNSTSYGTIAASNVNRKRILIFNDGPGNLLLTLGTATTATNSYTVKMSSGDYYEGPSSYTGLVGGIFATSGTARVTEIV